MKGIDAVIMAAGSGGRLWPITETRPKPLITMAGKTILQRTMESLKSAGISRFVIVIRDKAEMVKQEALKIAGQLGAEVSFADQEQHKTGTAIAIKSAKGLLGDRFIIASGDHILDSAIYKNLIEKSRGENTITVKPVENTELYGVARVEGEVVRDLVEKPEKPFSNLANIGIYFFNSGIFNEIEKIKPSKRGEYEITDILVGKRAVITERPWFDIGHPWNLIDAIGFLVESERDRRLGRVETSTIRGKVIIEEGAKVDNSVIEGPAYIGKNCEVGPFGYVCKACLEEGSAIGGGTTIKRSLLGKKSKAKHLSYIGDSIVGENVNFGSSTQIANLRFDGKNIEVKTKKGLVDSRRRKMGAVIGDNARFGVSTAIMPGRLIKAGAWILPGTVVKENIE